MISDIESTRFPPQVNRKKLFPFGEMSVLKVSITVQKSKLYGKQNLYRLPNYLPILQTPFHLQMKVVILDSNKNVLHGKSGG